MDSNEATTDRDAMAGGGSEGAILVAARSLTRHFHVAASVVRALDGVDLDVQRGEFLAVAGVSGSGKSTLLHLIGGLDTPTAGSVRVDGRDLHALSSYERSIYRRTVVGFVFQSFHLVPTLTALGNVQLALTFQGTYGLRRHELATESLERVGLKARSHHCPGQLSGGEQQRVAVARALVHRPRLLLADEPTGNLDRRTAREIVGLIRSTCRDLGTTVIMVTHDEEMASCFCDRMIRLRDGRLVAPERGIA
ncbi:MAG: ABC transporter ATP-binding protein [Planctomycetota bacterium]